MRQRDGQRAPYGFNIAIGDRTSLITTIWLHDCNPITIGDEVQIATRVHIYTATNPLEAKARRTVIETYSWQHLFFCPGVRIL